MLGFHKILRKEKKNAKENNFLMFNCLINFSKENHIQIKLFINLIILKLFNIYIDEF